MLEQFREALTPFHELWNVSVSCLWCRTSFDFCQGFSSRRAAEGSAACGIERAFGFGQGFLAYGGGRLAAKLYCFWSVAAWEVVDSVRRPFVEVFFAGALCSRLVALLRFAVFARASFRSTMRAKVLSSRRPIRSESTTHGTQGWLRVGCCTVGLVLPALQHVKLVASRGLYQEYQ